MDPAKLQAMLERMEVLIARGIVVEVSTRGPAPLVYVQVTDPNDSDLVPEITELALTIDREMSS